jgi:ribosome maturation factor RimP
MRYTPPQPDTLAAALEPVAQGLNFSIIETAVSHHKGSVQIRVVLYNGKDISLDNCAAFHHAALPRLELAFPGQDLYIEVSSPGIDRLIKDGAEFRHFQGRRIRCYRTDLSAWFSGLLVSSDENGIILEQDGQRCPLAYPVIAKARLEDR